MARVPVPAPVSPTRVRPLTDNRLVPVRHGVAELGESIKRTGQFMQEYANEQEQIDASLDRAAVRKADNEVARALRERLWTGENAYYRKEGFGALNDRPVVESEIEKLREQHLGAFTTERQRAMFSEVFERRTGAELEGIARHATQQARVEEKRQSLARITEASNDAVTYWEDPERRETAIQTALGELRSQTVSGGWAPETLKQAETEARSNIVGRAVEGMIDRGDVEGAQAAIAENRDALLPDTAAKLDGAIRAPLLEREADGIVDELLSIEVSPEPADEEGDTPSGSPSGTAEQTARARQRGSVEDRMVQITLHAESRNRDRNAQGGILRSAAGAMGRMQVMPATAQDPGYGIRPWDGKSLDDLARVGREKLGAMMKRYGNDPAKAWAAYNWGEGNVDRVVGKHGDRWLNFAPAETQAYVRGNMAALGGRVNGGGGVQQAPREHDMTKLLQRLDQMRLPFDVEQAVRRQLTARVSLDESLLARDRQDAVEDAWGVVEGLGTKFTSMTQLPAELRRRMKATDRIQFEGLAERNAAPKPTETNWQQYSRYSDLYATDPRALASINPAELRRNLSDSDFQQVMGWRRDILKGGAPDGRTAKQVTHERVRSVTNPLLAAAGITQPPDTAKDRRKDPEAQQRYSQTVGQFQRRVQDDIETWTRNNPNKEIDDNTIRDIADRQLLRIWRDDDGRTQQGFAFQVQGPLVGWNYQVPKAEADRIRGAYRRRWGRNPTPDELDYIYRHGPKGGR